jgi:sigma-B regulation protein RsbU (phosphoserine phosphatase)
VLHLSGHFFWKRLVPLPGVARNLMRGLTERARTTNQLALKAQRERLELEQLRKEIDLARQLQASMLPLRHPLFPDRSDLDVCARVEPTESVGGDFFDTFLTADGRLFVCIGDVSGHGIGAALLMARTIGLLRSLAMTAPGPEAVLQQLNTNLCEGNETCVFATLFCGYLEPGSGHFSYSNAGHCPPLLIRGDRSWELPLPRGPLAGVFPAASYRAETAWLETGDLLFAYTDGLTEAEDGEGRAFGLDTCMALLTQQGQMPLPVILDGVRDALAAFSGSRGLEDDCTLLLLRRT